MARQTGIIKLKGTLGDLTFYKSGGQYLVRQKSSLDRKRIATDPAFQRTRENGAEFGCAGRAGRVLRTAIRPLLGVAKDRFVTQRLTSALVRVLQADRVNPRGLRNVIDGDAELLTGFEFNRNAALGTTLHAPYRTDMDRQQGTLTLSVDPFVPSQRVVAPSGATHFKIVSAGTEIDFEGETFTTDCKETGYLPWDHDVTEAIVHVHQVTAGSVHPLFLVMGIVFFQEVNGVFYPLHDEACNALRVAAVSGGGKVGDVGDQSKEELSAVEASGGFSSFVLKQTEDQVCNSITKGSSFVLTQKKQKVKRRVRSATGLSLVPKIKQTRCRSDSVLFLRNCGMAGARLPRTYARSTLWRIVVNRTLVTHGAEKC